MTNQEKRDSYFAANPNIQSLYEEILDVNAANDAIRRGGDASRCKTTCYYV